MVGASILIHGVTQNLNIRLPRTVVPHSYCIELEPDIDKASFKGNETITIEVLQSVPEICLHALDMDISSCVLVSTSGDVFSPKNLSFDEPSQQLRLLFTEDIEPGQYRLNLSFTGIINDRLRGFYLSKYTLADGSVAALATTKFEPADARRAFPCWDEPDFKAVFQLSLIVPAQMAAVSNMHVLSSQPLADGKKKIIRFAPSIKMSSYLVAYIVGDLRASEAILTDNGAEIRVWSVPGKEHLSAFALKIARDSINYFSSYFNTNYPSKKLDLIAIPDFASGAMENYGAITFRETALLVDEAGASHAELERVAEVICHENAHMWFGDLVTMSWWNGLWLNEAFATFMAAKAVDYLYPEWKFWESFNVQRAAALRIDGLLSTRSIEFPVATPEDARAMFDVLTYEKGCAILRMLELFLGEVVFQQGIQQYLSKHAYGNTETNDLWKSLSAAAGETGKDLDIEKLMHNWVFTPGYPLISLEKQSAGKNGKSHTQLSIKQERFLYTNSTAKSDAQWHVPLALTQGERENRLLLDSTGILLPDSSAVLMNASGEGFFRVAYSPEILAEIISRFRSLPGPARFNVLNDMWALVLAGKTSLAFFVKTIQAYFAKSAEDDINVWSVILQALYTLRRFPDDANNSLKQSLSTLIIGLISQTIRALSFKPSGNESALLSQLRSQLLSALASAGDQEASEYLAKLYKDFLRRKHVHPSLIGSVLEYIGSHGSLMEYEQLLRLRKQAKTPQEENKLLFSLSFFRQKDTIERTLAACLSDNVRTQDGALLIRHIMNNPWAAWQAWEFITLHWDQLIARFPTSGMMRLIEGIICLVDPHQEKNIVSFMEEHPLGGTEKTARQSLEFLHIANVLAERETLFLARLMHSQ